MFLNQAVTHTLLLWRRAPFLCQDPLQPHMGNVGCVFLTEPWGALGSSSTGKKLSWSETRNTGGCVCAGGCELLRCAVQHRVALGEAVL